MSPSCLSAPRGRFQKQCSHTMCVLLFCMIFYLQAVNYHTKQQTLPFGSACIAFELLTRLELVTSSLPRKCSTTELQQQLSAKSRAKVMLFFISSKFGANKMRIKCCCHSKSVHKITSRVQVLQHRTSTMPQGRLQRC